jgi:hypothetical protein
MDKYKKLEDESPVVQIFRIKKLHIWFRDELPENSIIHDLPL